jgi:hypothetical protein
MKLQRPLIAALAVWLLAATLLPDDTSRRIAYAIEMGCPGDVSPNANVLLCDDFEDGTFLKNWDIGSSSRNPLPAPRFVLCGEGFGFKDRCAAWSNQLGFDGSWGFWGYEARRAFLPQAEFYVRWYQYISDPYPWGTLEDKSLLLQDSAGTITAYVGTSRNDLPLVPNSGPGMPFLANYQDRDWSETGGQYTRVNRFQNQGNHIVLQPGKWYLFEWYIRLNAPGVSDGVTKLWIDDASQPITSQTLRIHYNDMRWLRNSDAAKQFNVLRLSNYHQRCDGVPSTCPPNGPEILNQSQRWDQIVISKSPIGPLVLPAVSLTSPLGGAIISGTVPVSASVQDTGDIVGVGFQVDGAVLGAEDTTAPYSIPWDTTTVSEGAHTLTAVTRDAIGNTKTSRAVTVIVANTVTVTRLEDTNPAITYTYPGTWIERYTGWRNWSGGTAALGFAAGQRASVSFTGTGVSWIGQRGPWTGIANVYLDGTHLATVDTHAPAEVTKAVLFTASGLGSGAHTLVIEVPTPRVKNIASIDYFVVLDAVDVTVAPTPDSTPTLDITPPAVSIISPSLGATVSATTSVSSLADDGIGVGVAAVRFLADGVPIGPEDTVSPYSVAWDTTTVADGWHTLTAMARDAAGNRIFSAPLQITVANTTPPPPPTATRFENTDSSITYTPGVPGPGQPPAWDHGSRSRGWSDVTASFNRSAGARATFRFAGTRVSWIGFRAFWAGIAKVYLDDVFAAEVDLFLPRCTTEQQAQGCIDEQVRVPVFSASGIAAGNHTLTVEATGTKNAAAADGAVVVDAFDVAPAFPPPATGTRVEETVPALSYSAGWMQGDTGQAWSSGTAAVSATTGARATVTFTGTEISWFGLRGPLAGIARVFLDGAFNAEVDLYAPANIQGVVFSTTGLAAGEHTLSIEVSGVRNPAARSNLVFVDAFDVRSRFEERDSSFVYTGAWLQEHMDSAWSGTSANAGSGTAARSATAGARVEFTFTGTEARWIGFRGPSAGIADVSLDGVVVERVDLYSPTEELRVPVFTATALASGPHVLRIDVTGLKNGSAIGGFVVIDAVDVVLPSPAPPVSRVEQTHPSVTFTGGWTHSNPNSLFSGRTIAFSTTTGARASFTFTGTSVRWIGHRHRDGGIALVYLDGVPVGEIDTFAPRQDEFQTAVFSISGLSPGQHSLAIEVTGRKHGGDTCTPGPGPTPPPCSAGYMIVVDAFAIY